MTRLSSKRRVFGLGWLQERLSELFFSFPKLIDMAPLNGMNGVPLTTLTILGCGMISLSLVEMLCSGHC